LKSVGLPGALTTLAFSSSLYPYLFFVILLVIEGSRRNKKKKFQNQEKLNFKNKNISLRSYFFEKD
jgi:hypothetical protein